MTDLKYKLPEYPCREDMWDSLAKESRPIVVYGMGNGADKLFRRLEKYGVSVSDVFASDGFVRGHSYRGYRVKSFSEIKELYADFVILLSFASNRKDVVEMIEEIDREYELFIPDMPVTDESEYFDREFYNKNYSKIFDVYQSLADGESKNIYSAVLNYKLTGKLEYLMGAYTEKADMYNLISARKIETVVDAGAYNGDTAKEAIEYLCGVKRIYAIEPDRRNFKKLSRFAEEATVKITPINAVAWNSCQQGDFMLSGNRNSSACSTASHEHLIDSIPFTTIDCLKINAEYIKYDVEGAENNALVGSFETIKKSRPVLLVSIYHRSRDIFSLPEFVVREFVGYKLFVRRLYSIPAWELNLIALPIEYCKNIC